MAWHQTMRRVFNAIRTTRATFINKRFVVRVVGRSMEPTLRDGERLLARRGASAKAGDIVVFANPYAGQAPRYLVKRVVSELVTTEKPEGQAGGPFVLVAGDNPRSLGSERLGPIPTSSILGVVK